MYGHVSIRQNVFINHKAKFEWKKLSSVTKLAMRPNGAIYINMTCILMLLLLTIQRQQTQLLMGLF